MSKKYGNGVKRMAVDRTTFLQMCQKASMVKGNIPDELKLKYNNIAYCPVAYELSFVNGETKHTAILGDLRAKSIVYVDLERVEKYE